MSWDFENDGSIDSTERNPVHEFTDPGTYTVNLTATNENGTDSKSVTITVAVENTVVGQFKVHDLNASNFSNVPEGIYAAKSILMVKCVIHQ